MSAATRFFPDERERARRGKKLHCWHFLAVRTQGLQLHVEYKFMVMNRVLIISRPQMFFSVYVCIHVHGLTRCFSLVTGPGDLQDKGQRVLSTRPLGGPGRAPPSPSPVKPSVRPRLETARRRGCCAGSYSCSCKRENIVPALSGGLLAGTFCLSPLLSLCLSEVSLRHIFPSFLIATTPPMQL